METVPIYRDRYRFLQTIVQIIFLAKINQISLWFESCDEVLIPSDPIITSWDLGRGETEVLNWSFINPDWVSIIDDRTAKNCALSLNIRVRGTISIVLMAKEHQKIETVTPLLTRLEQTGFRIEPNLLNTALELAGEN